jgi:hypothetical protein
MINKEITKYNVIENYLNNNDAKEIEQLLFCDDFPWYYSKEILKNDGKFYFFHHLIKNNSMVSIYSYKIILPLINNFKNEIKHIHRARINCFTKGEKQIGYGQHYDHVFPHKILLYYVNTNNGYTYLNNKYKINSIKNNLAVIDGNIPHEIFSHTNTNLRITINITYS